MGFLSFFLAVLPLADASPTLPITPVLNNTAASESAPAIMSPVSNPSSIPGLVQIPVYSFPSLVDVFLIKDIPTVKLLVNGSEVVEAQLDTRYSSVLIGPECPAGLSKACESMRKIPLYRRFFRYERYDNFRYKNGYFQRLFSQDTLRFGSVDCPLTTVERLVNATRMFMSSLGLGLPGNAQESVIGRLLQENLINRNVFSLSLPNFSENSRGALTFGGLDKGKFSGSLTKVPLLPESGTFEGRESYWIHLSSVRLDNPAGGELVIDEGSQAVFVDSSRAESILPDAIVDKIWAEFTALDMSDKGEDSGLGSYFYNHTDMQRLRVDCGHQLQYKAIKFTFGDATISVPYHELVAQMMGRDCYLTVAKASSLSIPGHYSIGRSVMRSAYMIFDQDEKEIWMSQAQDCESDLQAVSSGASIGSVQGNCVEASNVAARDIGQDEGVWSDFLDSDSQVSALDRDQGDKYWEHGEFH